MRKKRAISSTRSTRSNTRKRKCRTTIPKTSKRATTSKATKTTKSRPIAVLDFETDPFVYGRKPEIFAAGFFDGLHYVSFWGDNAAGELLAYLKTRREPLTIYSHNGGRFDFLLILEQLENPLKIINGRITEARIGRHRLRDSFAILPIPLEAYEKQTKGLSAEERAAFYRRFERDQREQHRAEIFDYLRSDCVHLFDLVAQFIERFGPRLTIAGTAIRALAELHPLEKLDADHDATFRDFYFGGRVECFEAGQLEDSWIVADVNSMYPHAMQAFQHPRGRRYRVTGKLELDDPSCCFALVDASSAGALPVRVSSGLIFPHQRTVYYATAHELRAGLDTHTLEIHECLNAWYCLEMQDFGAFVDFWNREKIAAELRGDIVGRLFAKLILNSAYGKFAQDPENYFDYSLRRPDREEKPLHPWEIYADHGFAEVWRKPAFIRPGSYYDVAVAASITGAARACLLRALHSADRAVYCDTDSIICRALRVEFHPTRLGAWKIEESGDTCYVAGKKMYALARDGIFVKHASKGVEIPPEKIASIACGNVVNYFRDAPSLSLRGASFVSRKVEATAKFYERGFL